MVYLRSLTEYQKSLLTRLAYLNIDYYKYVDVKEFMDKIKLSDLRALIFNPNELYIGSLHMPRLKKRVTSIDTTTLEFIEKLEEAGLGNLEIIDYIDEAGFNAICFKDIEGDVGFSFRGTDLKTFSSFANDGLADIEAFLTNSNIQIKQGNLLFNKYKNQLGNNYLYGHSLGGFITESIYLENHRDIANAFVVNPFHINSEIIDSDEKIDAFNNSDKFSCFVIGGDYVSFINEPIRFEKNIHYVRNSNLTANNPFGNHMIEAGLFDERGNFIETNREDAFEGHLADGLNGVIHFIQDESVKEPLRNFFVTIKKYLTSLKVHFGKLFKGKSEVVIESSQEEIRKKSSDFDDYVNINNYPKDDVNKVQKRREIKNKIELEKENIR